MLKYKLGITVWIENMKLVSLSVSSLYIKEFIYLHMCGNSLT